ncbi:hypothetical protein LTR53_004324 [Teratosphaeriaceae sp. CCFEE 6253]|nr:hypothetical protein LTR53_004324 [Teratosphaeriaceae sp. CCFEE 6253]
MRTIKSTHCKTEDSQAPRNALVRAIYSLPEFSHPLHQRLHDLLDMGFWNPKRKAEGNPNEKESKRPTPEHDAASVDESEVAVPHDGHAPQATVDEVALPHLPLGSAEVRRMMYEHQIKLGHAIRISGPNGIIYEPHFLANAAADVRNEALPMFYCDNDFLLQVFGYNIRHAVVWLKHANAFRRPDLGVVCLGTVRLMTSCEPHWENLVHWLRSMHAGEVVALDDSCEIDCDDEGGQVGVVKGVFTQVALLKGCEWAVVEKMLPGVREALGAIDAEWLVNRRLSGMLEAMTARDDTVANRPRKLAPPSDKDSEGFFRHEHRADEGSSTQQSYKTAFGTQPVEADGQSEDDDDHPAESMTARGDSLSQRLSRPYAYTATTRHSPELPWGPSDEDAVSEEKGTY